MNPKKQKEKDRRRAEGSRTKPGKRSMPGTSISPRRSCAARSRPRKTTRYCGTIRGRSSAFAGRRPKPPTRTAPRSASPPHSRSRTRGSQRPHQAGFHRGGRRAPDACRPTRTGERRLQGTTRSVSGLADSERAPPTAPQAASQGEPVASQAAPMGEWAERLATYNWEELDERLTPRAAASSSDSFHQRSVTNCVRCSTAASCLRRPS